MDVYGTLTGLVLLVLLLWLLIGINTIPEFGKAVRSILAWLVIKLLQLCAIIISLAVVLSLFLFCLYWLVHFVHWAWNN